MRKKILSVFLISMIIIIISSTTAQAIPNLKVNQVIKTRLSQCHYLICYQLRNTGTNDLEDTTFWDAAGFKESGIWVTIPESLIQHVDFDLPAGQNSEWFCYETDTPLGWTWFVQCTDEYDDVDEANENDNCLLKFWYFW